MFLNIRLCWVNPYITTCLLDLRSAGFGKEKRIND